MQLTVRRLLVLTILTASGAIASATAASVYAAGEPLRRRSLQDMEPRRNEAALLSVIADSTRSSVQRTQALRELAAGSCYSVREMLFGASRERQALVRQALNVMQRTVHDVPNVDDIVRGHATDTRVVSTRRPSDRVLRWLLPMTIERRVDFCRNAA